MNGYHNDPLIDAAISSAYQSHPYYGSAISKLRIVADRNVPTMATSKDWVTHYNPATVAGWTVAERGAVLVHEVEHLLKRHHDRCGDRDPGRFNVAGDAEINQRLNGLPEGAVYPESLGMPRGRTAEVYYGAADGPKPKSDDGAPGDGAPGDGAPGDGAPGDGAPGAPAKCGSAAGGPVQPHEQGDAKAPGAGAADDGAEARKDAAQAIIGAGTEVGTELREWAERELGIDRAAWYSALSSAVGHVMAPYGAPTRWAWPGRRDMRDMGGAMVPRWTGERPSCAIVIDTSSSITPFDLEMAAAAGHYIGRIADAVYYSCDTVAVRLGSTIPEHLRGGGGTDMAAGIEMAIAEGARAVVVITDCMTPWPLMPTTVPIIVGANPGSARILSGEIARMYPGLKWSSPPPDWMTVLPVVNPDLADLADGAS